MRQIIFKAKRVDNGEWVEGSLLTTKYNSYIIPMHDESVEAVSNISVIPETVCQYTGLSDKNGKMIFDDDIRKDNEGTEFRIYRTFGGFVIKAKYWMSDIKNLVSGDELIFKSLSDPQLADWIKNDTTHVRNIHD